MFFLGARWAVRKLEGFVYPKVTRASGSNHAYDKAKYHSETIEELGLPPHNASLLDVFFLSWLIKRGLTSGEFESAHSRELKRYRKDQLSIQDFYYERCDGCLVSDMLNDEGNAFATAYFDFQHGNYLADYEKHLQKDLPSAFHVTYTQENERRFHAVIDARYAQWKQHGVAVGGVK